MNETASLFSFSQFTEHYKVRETSTVLTGIDHDRRCGSHSLRKRLGNPQRTQSNPVRAYPQVMRYRISRVTTKRSKIYVHAAMVVTRDPGHVSRSACNFALVKNRLHACMTNPYSANPEHPHGLRNGPRAAPNRVGRLII